jgi:serine/threonine protein kinase
MDYCPGGDLESVLRKIEFVSEKVAKIYIAEITLALEVLHENCIIFR